MISSIIQTDFPCKEDLFCLLREKAFLILCFLDSALGIFCCGRVKRWRMRLCVLKGMAVPGKRVVERARPRSSD